MNDLPNPLLDQKQLRSLQSLNEPGQSDIVTDLMRIFFNQTPELILKLKSAAKNSKAETIQALAHKLKGSCANIGARQLSNLAATIEEGHSELSPSELNTQLEAIDNKYIETKNALITFHNGSFGNQGDGF